MPATSSFLSPLAEPPFPVRRFSITEYHRMVRAGVLSENDRVELLEGWIVPKMTHNPSHDATVELAAEALRSRLPAGWRLRIQSAITTQDSEPEPDVVIVRGSARDHVSRHPGPPEIALLIEVAETSLERDRKKCRLYARAAVPVYWIINLVDAQVEVHTDPTGPAAEAAFRCSQVYRFGQAVPLAIAGRQVDAIAVAELLP